MNTHDDGTTVAVQHVTAGAESWRSAVHSQQSTDPDHSDWYAITGEMVETLRCLASMVSALGQQIHGYGTGRVLRDDAGADPSERLAQARSLAAQVRADLDRAERTANTFWSEIGHIAVEVDR